MAKNKRQHTVQRAYLHKWTIDGKVQVFDLEKDLLHEGDPASLFRENYIYNWPDFDDDRKYMIDDLITAIENEGLPVIEKLIDGSMTREDKMKLSNYITIQTLRTPRTKEMMHEIFVEGAKKHMIEQLKDPESVKEFAANSNKDVAKFLTDLAVDPERKVAELFDEKFQLKLNNIREIWLQTSMHLLQDLSQRNYNADWFLFKAGRNHSFITSDNPVVTMSSVRKLEGATSQDVNHTEVTFPLTPKHMLLIRKNSAQNKHTNSLGVSEIFEDGDSMREFNWRTASHADRYLISQSDRLVKKVAELSSADWREARYSQERAKHQVAGLIHVTKEVKSKTIKPISRVSHV